MHRWLVPHVVAPLYEHVSGRRPWTTLRRLQELQWRAPAELEARTVHGLRGLLAMPGRGSPTTGTSSAGRA